MLSGKLLSDICTIKKIMRKQLHKIELLGWGWENNKEKTGTFVTFPMGQTYTQNYTHMVNAFTDELLRNKGSRIARAHLAWKSSQNAKQSQLNIYKRDTGTRQSTAIPAKDPSAALSGTRYISQRSRLSRRVAASIARNLTILVLQHVHGDGDFIINELDGSEICLCYCRK